MTTAFGIVLNLVNSAPSLLEDVLNGRSYNAQPTQKPRT
jgi:hypothetical protein